MDTRNNSKWEELLAAARDAKPPEDIDVRVSVRRAIEEEQRTGTQGVTLWEALGELCGQAWFKGLLGGGAIAAIPFVASVAQVARDLLDVAHLSAPFVTGF